MLRMGDLSCPLPPPPLGFASLQRRYLPPCFAWGTCPAPYPRLHSAPPRSSGGTFPHASHGGLVLPPTPASTRLRLAPAADLSGLAGQFTTPHSPVLPVEQRPVRVVHPVAPDEQLLPEDPLTGEAELLGDAIGRRVAHGDAEHGLVLAQGVERLLEDPVHRLGAHALAGLVGADPVADLDDLPES